MSEEEAVAALNTAGFTNVTVGTEMAEGDPGRILNQDPPAGAEVEEATEVVLVVSELATIEVPDVVGASRAEAEAELSALGVGTVEILAQGSVEPVDTVLVQRPEAGEEIAAADPVVLTVAESVETPDFSTMAMSEVRGFVENLGGEVETATEYNVDGEDGDFVAQLPAAGQPVAETVVITTTQGPSHLFLNEIEWVEQESPYADVSFGVGEINGELYTNSLLVQTISRRDAYVAATIEYNLSRDFDRLKASVGYEDNADAAGQMRLEFLADGEIVFSRDYRLGEPIDEISVDVTDVLRLKLVVTNLNGESGDLVLGQIRLAGSEDAVDARRQQSED
jgi:hypothetical protein